MFNIEHSYIIPFKTRSDRYQFLMQEFRQELDSSDSILDVGCDKNELKNKLGNKVFGIDFGGDPDLKVDLEKEKLSKFKDNQYDLIVSLNVLEHLENFHEVIDDINRVAKKSIMLALPNCSSIPRIWHALRTLNTGNKYGLPLNKPKDRHKWYFSYREIIDFIIRYAEKNNLEIEKLILHYDIGLTFKNNIIHKIKHKLIYLIVRTFKVKSFAQEVFILLKK